MNERILELARQVWPDPNISHVNHMKFAELLIRECLSYAKEGDLDFMKFMIKQNFGVECEDAAEHARIDSELREMRELLLDEQGNLK